MLQFEFNFWNENGRALQKPDLTCLRQDHLPYKSLLFQLHQEIEFDEKGIRFKQESVGLEKFQKFILKAIEENVQLAIAPEYSCPWKSIDSFILNNQLPSLNNVWILGCQSITSKEIKALIQKHNNKVWIFDEELVSENIASEKFYDPVCIIFKTKNLAGEIVDVIIIQFKTFGFGSNGFQWERDNSIPGKKIFVLENLIASTKLITIICSDTLQNLDFITVNNGYFLNESLLIIHIQLNSEPFQATYKSYRNLLFAKGSAKDWNKEIICLNWARNIAYEDNGHKIIFNKYGGSALYCKTTEINRSDSKLNINHSKGMYYTYWNTKRSHVSFINYDEYVFLIESSKPSQIASDPTQFERTGPSVLKTFKWNNNWEETARVLDGFDKICEAVEDEDGFLSCLTTNSNYIEVERIIQLSCGEVDASKKLNWSDIENLYSFQIGDTEFNSRNTFVQDPDADSNEIRINRIRRYFFLKSILRTSNIIPDPFKNALLKFKDDVNFPSKYSLNIHSVTTDRMATAIYAGDKTPNEARAMKDRITSIFNKDQQGKLVMVLFNSPQLEIIYDDKSKPLVDENVAKPTTSYRKIQ